MPASPCEAAVSDAELVSAARSGDRQAFGELVYRYRETAVRVVARMVGDPALAEDAAQEAFLRAWQRLHTYKPEYAFRSWICSIAVHAALDWLRREPHTSDVDELPLEGGPRPEGEAEASERAAAVRKAVLALPPASRAVLVLREWEGLTYAEIAEALKVPIGTVMSRLNYARTQLRQSLAGLLA